MLVRLRGRQHEVMTGITTVAEAARPVSPSTIAMPVMTSCCRPRRRTSMARASSPLDGLPSAMPSMTTTVSAARTTAAPAWRATARAFRSASPATASGVGPPSSVSSISLGITSNSARIPRRSSRRRGDRDARINLMALVGSPGGGRGGASRDPCSQRCARAGLMIRKSWIVAVGSRLAPPRPPPGEPTRDGGE